MAKEKGALIVVDEKTNDRLATDEELLSYMKKTGIKTILDIRIQEVKDNTFMFSLVPNHWEEFENFLNITEDDWEEYKYFNESGEVSEEVKNIPNNKGGIYLYVVKPPVPIRYMPIIMYVGRAHNNGNSQNLRKRVNNYAREAKDFYRGRKAVRSLFSKYAEYLHVMYISLDKNEDIDRLEKELISAIVPACNRELIQVSLKEGRSAF